MLESSDIIPCKWYGGIEVEIDLEAFAPNTAIPVNASTVTVGENLTSGIDFYFDLSTDVNLDDGSAIIQRFELRQNYPNPFNPVTTIQYQLSQQAFVQIHIYNLLGQRVATLVNNWQSIGLHTVIWNAIDVPSGVYFYRIEAGEFTQTKKCILLK